MNVPQNQMRDTTSKIPPSSCLRFIPLTYPQHSCADSQLQVENELFRVHRYFFTQHSLFFQGLFSLPQGDQDEREWSGTEKNPLHLPDVTKDQLEVLLDFFYKG